MARRRCGQIGGSVFASILRSIIHNVVVVFVGFCLAYVGTLVDTYFKFSPISSPLPFAAGILLVALGFLLRVWATTLFYEHRMRVISLSPQGSLITSGPYRFTRNPLYLGGNVFIFFGAALVLGSPTALIVTALHLPLVDLMIRREERQMEQAFGEQFLSYKRGVRRWI
jgi:protein-S-isoprenylcysteine O-methyltransferase Ste14